MISKGVKRFLAFAKLASASEGGRKRSCSTINSSHKRKARPQGRALPGDRRSPSESLVSRRAWTIPTAAASSRQHAKKVGGITAPQRLLGISVVLDASRCRTRRDRKL